LGWYKQYLFVANIIAMSKQNRCYKVSAIESKLSVNI